MIEKLIVKDILNLTGTRDKKFDKMNLGKKDDFESYIKKEYISNQKKKMKKNYNKDNLKNDSNIEKSSLKEEKENKMNITRDKISNKNKEENIESKSKITNEESKYKNSKSIKKDKFKNDNIKGKNTNEYNEDEIATEDEISEKIIDENINYILTDDIEKNSITKDYIKYNTNDDIENKKTSEIIGKLELTEDNLNDKPINENLKYKVTKEVIKYKITEEEIKNNGNKLMINKNNHASKITNKTQFNNTEDEKISEYENELINILENVLELPVGTINNELQKIDFSDLTFDKNNDENNDKNDLISELTDKIGNTYKLTDDEKSEIKKIILQIDKVIKYTNSNKFDLTDYKIDTSLDENIKEETTEVKNYINSDKHNNILSAEKTEEVKLEFKLNEGKKSDTNESSQIRKTDNLSHQKNKEFDTKKQVTKENYNFKKTENLIVDDIELLKDEKNGKSLTKDEKLTDDTKINLIKDKILNVSKDNTKANGIKNIDIKTSDIKNIHTKVNSNIDDLQEEKIEENTDEKENLIYKLKSDDLENEDVITKENTSKIKKVTVEKVNLEDNEGEEIKKLDSNNGNSKNSQNNLKDNSDDKKFKDIYKINKNENKEDKSVSSEDFSKINITNNYNNDKDIITVMNKTNKEQVVQKSDILNQLVESTKVMVTEDKSEIVISLKPEALGKLTLKVITENGIVMAKFAAESQQVKEIIESNMQILKDSLEKQGLSIEGFSVSVNDQSKKNQNFEKQQEEKKKNTKQMMNYENSIKIDKMNKNTNMINPYTISQSQINFTA
ncbi:MAG: flagellar hook-length control protein FliK [Clostridiales bacterium]